MYDNEDDFFSDVTGGASSTDTTNDSNNNSSQNSDSNTQYVKKKKNENIIGENDLNLWNKDVVAPVTLNEDDFEEDVKYITLVLPSKRFRIKGEDEREKVLKFLKRFKDKGYKLRFICNFIRDIFDDAIDIFGEDGVEMYTPWATYCKDVDTTYKMRIPSDKNIQLAHGHIKNIDNKPPFVKYLNATILSTLFGTNNKKPSSYILTYDSNWSGKMLDFKLSVDNANYILLRRELNLNIYNLHNKNNVADLAKLLT